MLRFLVRQGLRRGLVGGSRRWLVVGVAAGAAAVVRRVLEERPETVYRAPITPGETLVLRGLGHERGGEDEAVP